MKWLASLFLMIAIGASMVAAAYWSIYGFNAPVLL